MQSNQKNLLVAGNLNCRMFTYFEAGCILVGAAFFSYPIYVARNPPTLVKSDNSLNKNAVMRGPYMNSGSTDVGPDPERPIKTNKPPKKE